MESALKVKIIHEENIKPSIPTPQTQNYVKFSFLDQLALPVYVPLLLFYTPNHNHNPIPSKSHLLKSSLSKTLTLFYPFAGRVNDDNLSISCTDQGAIYVEAEASCRLSNILTQLNVDSLNQLLPFPNASAHANKGCIVLIQTTFFPCGGITVGLLISHKIADASSISSFIKTWTSIAVSGNDSLFPKPEFIGDSVLPAPKDFPVATPTTPDSGIHAKGVTKRIVFSGSKIASLKAKAASTKVKQPTRVEAVAGLLWKSAISAAKSTSGISKASVLGQAVNLRKRLEPNLGDTSIGNSLGFVTPETAVAAEIDLQGTVGLLREAIEEFKESGYKKYQDTEAYLRHFKTLTDPDGPYSGEKNFYLCSSWSRFQFYEADFGWGLPVWFIGGISMFSNFFLLMDTRDGKGIEALVTLSEEDMAVFQCDQDLLAFASFNPNVLQLQH
ncbi:unnamed protein product [Citrullus colocynthis]|uniref:BAHD acyltransferase n=1 Tax=Citrullus colocynthis TaxID=252529 RepID=A0ABP0Z7B3_9ROSI